jgi:tetratricopeptide (TPR) repeat protein
MANSELSARFERLSSFLSQDPDNINLFHDWFEQGLQLGAFDQISVKLDQLIQNLPSDASLIFAKTKLLIAKGDFNQAIELCNSLIENGIINTGVIYNKCWSQLNAGQHQEIIDQASDLDKYVSEYPPILLVLARAYHHLGDMEQAITIVDRFISLMPDSPEAHGLKSMLMLDLGQYDGAKASADRSLELNPYNHEALITLSSVALTQQDPDEALKHLEANQKVMQQSGRMMLNYGQVLMLNMQFDQAEDALKQAVNLMPEHIGTWHALAWVQLVLDKVSDAKRCFERAMDIDRNFADSHGGLAIIAICEGDLDAADKRTKTAIRLDPMSASGRYAESLLLEKRGNPEEAKKRVTEMLTSTMGVDGKPITQHIAKAVQRLNLSSKNKTIH